MAKQLRGVAPESIQKRLKVLFYGTAGAGKTTAAIQFPAPYLIDTERGAENKQYVKLLKQKGGVIFQTTDFEELINEVTTLLTVQHEYKTLIIDPLTIVYNDLLDKSAEKHGTEFGRHYNDANKRIKHLLNLLLRLDMNVIITSHAKVEYQNVIGPDGKPKMVADGQTFDCYKKLDYLFDLVFEVQKRGDKRIGIVRKSRIESFPDGENFPFNYDEIANKYGRDILERESKAQELATEKQIKQLLHLIELLNIPFEVCQKWLDKSDSEKWEEMPTNSIQKCIEFLESKLKGEAA